MLEKILNLLCAGLYLWSCLAVDTCPLPLLCTSQAPVTLISTFWLVSLYFMPRKRQFLLWFHAGIAKQGKNIATSKICLTIFKMLEWANSPYQSLCKGIKPVSQITLFIISLGLFPNNLENVWLFLYLKRVCPVPERGYGVFTKWGYLAWVAVFRILINWMVLAILLLKIVQPSSELDRGGWFDFCFCFFFLVG